MRVSPSDECICNVLDARMRPCMRDWGRCRRAAPVQEQTGVTSHSKYGEPDLHLRSTAVRPRVVRNHLETRMVGLARTVIRRHVQRGVGSVIRCAQRGNTHRLQSFEDPSACSACNVFTCGIADPVIPQRCTVIAALRTVDHRAAHHGEAPGVVPNRSVRTHILHAHVEFELHNRAIRDLHGNESVMHRHLAGDVDPIHRKAVLWGP